MKDKQQHKTKRIHFSFCFSISYYFEKDVPEVETHPTMKQKGLINSIYFIFYCGRSLTPAEHSGNCMTISLFRYV